MIKLGILRVFIPMILGAISAALCQIPKDAGKSVAFRPPGWVFSIVWPLLYIMVGISWYISAKSSDYHNAFIDLCFALLNVILCTWIIVYGCVNNKILGVYIISAAILMCILTMIVIHHNKWGLGLLSPLLVWLVFALLLNAFETHK
jgi:translocator protein